jgi:hypothetical protein
MIFGWYGLGRMFIEGLRMDSLYSEIFGLQFRTSQVLAAIIFTVCLGFYIYFLIKRPIKPFFVKEAVVAEGKSNDAQSLMIKFKNWIEKEFNSKDSSKADDAQSKNTQHGESKEMIDEEAQNISSSESESASENAEEPCEKENDK